MPAVEGQQRHQVDDAQDEVQLGQEQPERHPDAVVDGVAADDARADNADRGVERTLSAADRVDQRADFVGIATSDLPSSTVGLPVKVKVAGTALIGL